MSLDNRHPEAQFLDHLDTLGVPLWVGYSKDGWFSGNECSRPPEWQKLTCEENLDRLARLHFDFAPFICANTGIRVAVFDSDTKNGGDPEKVRALLDEYGVRIFAEVDTPSGGKHFYVKGSRLLPTVHSRPDNPKLPDYPGLDIQSHGANVFAPGTMRPKYGYTGYRIVFDHLDQIPVTDDDEPTPLTDWVAEQRVQEVKAKARKTSGGAREWTWDPCEPWDGTPPDRRQSAYLAAATRSEADKVAKTTKGGRNEAIFTGALKLGSYVAGAGLHEPVVIAALEGAAEANGYTAEHTEMATRATIRSGLRGGRKNPRAVPPRRRLRRLRHG